MRNTTHTLVALSSAAAITLGASYAHATEVGSARTFGLGFAFGNPASLVGKVFVGRENAVDFGIGFFRLWDRCRRDNGREICGDFGSLTLNADYLWQFDIVQGRAAQLDWHIGAGGRVWLFDGYYNDDVAMAARMPVGLDLTFRKPSFLEVFLEIAPAIYVFPNPGPAVEGFLGVRFYF